MARPSRASVGRCNTDIPQVNRPRGTRTPNIRIWNPTLYHWSYWPFYLNVCLFLFLFGVFYMLVTPLAILLDMKLALFFEVTISHVIATMTLVTDKRYVISHFSHEILRSANYARIFVTTPEPTVRPPSRIAKRRPSSIAMGANNSTVSSTLSPGITISRSPMSVAAPVTSVVRK